jgi:hypothetical protein
MATDREQEINHIRSDAVKEKLTKANRLLSIDSRDSEGAGGNIVMAKELIAEAFRLVLSQHGEGTWARPDTVNFPFGDFNLREPSYTDTYWDSKQREDMQSLVKLAKGMQESMKLPYLGQDLRKYRRFKRLTTAGVPGLPDSRRVTKEDLDFCLDFAIDTARRKQEFDEEEG